MENALCHVFLTPTKVTAISAKQDLLFSIFSQYLFL